MKTARLGIRKTLVGTGESFISPLYKWEWATKAVFWPCRPPFLAVMGVVRVMNLVART